MRELLAYMPLNNAEDAPFAANSDDPNRRDEALDTLVPENPNKPYDMRDIIQRVVDERPVAGAAEGLGRRTS